MLPRWCCHDDVALVNFRYQKIGIVDKLVRYFFIYNNLFFNIIEDKGRTCQTIQDRDRFIPRACLCKNRKFIDVRLNIFYEFNYHFFFLLVSGKKKLSPNYSRHCTLVGIENEDRLINHFLRIETGEEEGTFWKNISGFTLMLILEELEECEGILCEKGKVKELL